MGEITSTPAFQTTDGKLFIKQSEAEDHQTLLNFKEWYTDNQLYGNIPGSEIEFNDMCEWLSEHKEQVFAYLNNSG